MHKQTQGKISPDAVSQLETAIDLAIEPGYFMLFLEEGPVLIPLLQALIKQQTAPNRVRQYAQNLLKSFSKNGQTLSEKSVPVVDQLVEQLTQREMEVLQLIAAGDSNQEIAEKLVITVRTVKKHTSNIYGKLNVSSRTQAVACALELELL